MLFDRKKLRAAKGGDPQTDLRVQLHRNRMAGLWAAELLGLLGHAAQDYAREVAHAPRAANQPDSGAPPDEADEDETEIAPHDDAHVLSRLTRDLHGKVSAQEIRVKLGHLLSEARRQLLNDRRNS